MNEYRPIEVVCSDGRRRIASLEVANTLAALRAQVEDLKSAGRTARDDATSALDLLSRVRFALGDNGTRMQGELMAYCRELAALPGRVAELEAQSEELARIADEHVNTAHRYRDALERLARLGNEPYYGNSIGNRIAQDALGIEVGLNA